MALEFKKVLAKPLVASEDMTAEMAGETVEIITAAVDKFLSTENYEKAAQAVKDGMDRKFGPTWHCCIGEGFGYDVTYNTRNMLLLYYGEKLGILGAWCGGACQPSARTGRSGPGPAGRRPAAAERARIRASPASGGGCSRRPRRSVPCRADAVDRLAPAARLLARAACARKRLARDPSFSLSLSHLISRSPPPPRAAVFKC